MDNRYHQREKFIKIIEVQPQRATYTYITRHWRTWENQIFKSSGFITENHNGDTLVPDSLMPSSVVAIDRDGNHRFSYNRHPGHTRGQFISFWNMYGRILTYPNKWYQFRFNTYAWWERSIPLILLINALESFGPYTLSYDVNTQNLWVGTGNNNIIYAFKYIDWQDIVTRKFVSQYFFNDKFRRKFQKFDILHLEQ